LGPVLGRNAAIVSAMIGADAARKRVTPAAASKIRVTAQDDHLLEVFVPDEANGRLEQIEILM